MNDPIADLLTRVRNGCMAEKSRVDVPASRFKKGVLDVLLKEGFIRRYKLIKDDKQDILRVYLKYYNNKSVIQGIERVSKPGLRRYVASEDLPVIRNGFGIGVISTSTQGVITAKEAKKHRVGGEYICKVW